MNEFLVGRKSLLSINARELALFILCLNNVFIVFNKDAYLGIADYFYFFLLFILLSLLSRNTYKISREGKLVLIVLGYLMVAFCVAAIQGVISTGYFFSYAVYLLTLLIVVNQRYSELEIRRFVDFYIAAAVIVSVILFVQRYDFYGGGNVRHTIKLLGHEAFDPNFLAAFLVVPALLAFAKVIYRFSVKVLLAFLLIVAAILYTSSRGASISIALGIVVILLGLIKGKKKMRRLVLLAIVVVVAVIVAQRFIPMSSLTRLINIRSYLDSSNAKRLLDWKYGLKAFYKRPMLGYGLQGEMTIIINALGVRYISHNTFIALLLQFGAAGIIVFLSCFIKMIKGSGKNSVIMAMVFSTFSVSFLVSGEVAVFFWMPMILIVSASALERQSRAINTWL